MCEAFKLVNEMKKSILLGVLFLFAIPACGFCGSFPGFYQTGYNQVYNVHAHSTVGVLGHIAHAFENAVNHTVNAVVRVVNAVDNVEDALENENHMVHQHQNYNVYNPNNPYNQNGSYNQGYQNGQTAVNQQVTNVQNAYTQGYQNGQNAVNQQVTNVQNAYTHGYQNGQTAVNQQVTNVQNAYTHGYQNGHNWVHHHGQNGSSAYGQGYQNGYNTVSSVTGQSNYPTSSTVPSIVHDSSPAQVSHPIGQTPHGWR
jgi:hypothetical protein